MAAAIRDQLGALSAKLARGRGIAALHTARATTTAVSAAFGSAVGGVGGGGTLPGAEADVEVVETTALAATAGAVLRALIMSKEQGASV